MSSHSLIPLNDRANYVSEKTKQNKKDNKNSYKHSLTSFKGFSSALFMTDYQGNEDNVLSQKSNKTGFSSSSNSNSNKEKIKFSPSLEKCLTSELLDSITNDSSNLKKWKNHRFSNYEIDLKDFSQKEDNPQDFLKITKNLFIQENQEHTPFKGKNKDFIEYDDGTNFKDKKTISIYEDTIKSFEYQLKFIENSVHNILPKSYKKLSEKSNKSNSIYYNNNNYPNNNNQSISPFSFSNEYKNNDNNCNYSLYKNMNNDYLNNNMNVSEFEPYDFETDLKVKSCKAKNENNAFSYNINTNNKINQFQHQIHKLKISDSYYGDWICNKCNCINRGYRKACSKCGLYRSK